jgi:hypothetical protein
MTKLRDEDWVEILTATGIEMVTAIQNGTLKPPCTVLITGSDDEVVTEFQFEFDATREIKITQLSADRSVTAITFPVVYTVTDSQGKEMEAVLSEEVVHNLRKVS